MNFRHATRSLALLCTLSLLAGCSSSPAPGTRSTAPCTDASSKEKEVIQWFTANAKPLQGVAPGAETTDLQPLKEMLDGVRVVGLGEGSLGSHEHVTMNHRLLQFLVKEMGYRTVAVPASYTASLVVNRYLQTGEGDPKEVLKEFGYWWWYTDEFRTTLEWMRAYNESVPSDQRVQFVGLDIQYVNPGVSLIYKYLEAVHPAEVERFKWHLDELRLTLETVHGRSAEIRETHRQELQALVDLIAQDPEATPSAPIDRATAHKIAINLYRYYDAAGIPTDQPTMEQRYRAYMDEVIKELLDELGPTGKAALWGHNMNLAGAESVPGAHLRKQLGNAYYALGYELYRGEVRITPLQNGRQISSPTAIPIGEPPRESAQWVLNCAGLGNSLIDLRGGDKSKTVETWQASERPLWWFAYALETKAQPVPDQQERGRLNEFDGLIYIPESTATVRVE